METVGKLQVFLPLPSGSLGVLEWKSRAGFEGKDITGTF